MRQAGEAAKRAAETAKAAADAEGRVKKSDAEIQVRWHF